jgi:hypothetical protein
MPDVDDVQHDLHQFSFGVDRSILYHNLRSDFLRRLSKCCSLVGIITGAGTFAAVLGAGPKSLQLALPVLTTLVSALNLIFDFRGASEQHKQLSAKFSELMHSIEVNRNPTQEALVDFYHRRRMLENDAPAPMKMLDVHCHNHLIRSRGYDSSEFVDLNCAQRFFAHWISLGSVPAKRGSRGNGA